MIKKIIKPFLLNLENSIDLSSILLNNESTIIYKEINKKQNNLKYTLNIIDILLKKNKISPEKIDGLSFGYGPGNFTNTRTLTSIVQSLALGWKLPIIKVSLLSIIALEALFLYNCKNIFVALKIDTHKIYCNSFLNGKISLNEIEHKVKDINDTKLIRKKIIGITNISNENINILKRKNPFLEIKKIIHPKAIYLDSIARSKFCKNKIITPNKIKALYLKNNSYKKYKTIIKRTCV